MAFVPVIKAISIAQEDVMKVRPHRIAFTSKRDGSFDIYTINDNGTDLKRLTNNQNDDIKPQWAPNGDKILYYSKKGKECALWVMNYDGSSQVKLAENCNSDFLPLWSPDSLKILFVAKIKKKNAIFTVDSDGGNLTRLTELDAEGKDPSWSPDGSQILFLEKYRRNTYIYVMKSDGTDRKKIAGEKEDYQNPVWSIDGQKIAYISTKRKLTGTYNQIFVMNSDGTNNLELANGSKKVEDIVSIDSIYWSPDGTTIVFTKVADVEAKVSEKGSVTYNFIYGVYIVGTNGNDYDRLLEKTGEERAIPDWSSDSLKVAFLSNSRLMIYNMKTKINEEIRVNVSIPLSPVKWSPDGTKLIFAGKNSSFQKSALYLVTLDGKVTKLSEANDYDPVWAPK
ncbi:MAG: TolB family protein [Bacteroidota bacterium]